MLIFKRVFAMFATILLFSVSAASASNIFWTDWSGSNTGAFAGLFVGNGTITTSTSTVTVTYRNPQGIAFYQASGGTDYWTNGCCSVRNPAASPYTGATVDNIPTGTDIVALQFAGNQTLSFSEPIANPVFSFVSLNGNGYAFLNQDFDILSYGDPSDGNSCGYWGCGKSFKNIVTLPNGDIEYQLVGTGEPHGTIRFKGSFDTLTWRSLSNEYWNGFTVGVEGTSHEVFVPEPSTFILLGTGLLAILIYARRRKYGTGKPALID